MTSSQREFKLTPMCPQDQKADMWKQDAEVTEKIRKVKGDIGPFTISLEEWDPGIVA